MQNKLAETRGIESRMPGGLGAYAHKMIRAFPLTYHASFFVAHLVTAPRGCGKRQAADESIPA